MSKKNAEPKNNVDKLMLCPTDAHELLKRTTYIKGEEVVICLYCPHCKAEYC